MIKPLITKIMLKPEKCYPAFEMFRLNFLLICQTQAILSREGETKEVDFHVNSLSDCTPFHGIVALFVRLQNFAEFLQFLHRVTHGTCSIFSTYFWEGITNTCRLHLYRPHHPC